MLAFVYSNREHLSYNPFDTSYSFESPYWAVLDKQNFLYMVDSNSKRLTKMTIDGEVQWYLTGGERAEGKFYDVRDFCVSSRGDIYITNAVVDIYSTNYTKFDFLKYSPDGNFVKTACRYDRNISSFFLIKNYAEDKFYYCVYEIATNEAMLTSFDMATDTTAEVSRIKFDYNGFRGITGWMGAATSELMLTSQPGDAYGILPGGSVEVRIPAGTMPYFDQIWPERSGKFAFNTFDDMNIYRMTGDRTASVFLSKERIRELLGANNFYFLWVAPGPRDEIVTIDKISRKIVIISSAGELIAAIGEGRLSRRLMLKRSLVLFFALLLALAALRAIAMFYYRVFAKKTSIIIQDIATFTPLLVVSIIVTAATIYGHIYPLIEQEYGKRLMALAQLGAKRISCDALEKINTRSDFLGDSYNLLQEQMKKILNDNRDEWNRKFTANIYRLKNDIVHVICDTTYYYSTLEPFPYATPAHYETFSKGGTRLAEYMDTAGRYRVATAPIRNAAGEIVGVFEVGSDYYNLAEIKNIFLYNLSCGVAIALVVYFSLLAVLSYFLLVAIRVLRNIVNKITSGDFEINVALERADELGDLGDGINYMTRSLRDYIKHVMELNAAYFRFVPKNFVDLLGKESVLSVAPGDNVSRNMAVLFSDIRSFTSLSEKMTPQENFNFINSYLKRMGPVIRENSGFIDKYIGDAIMALFESAGCAVGSAAKMIEKLGEYNLHRKNSGYDPISIGIGIHFGPLMLGVVGENERINATVISEDVNIASRLEGLCKHFGAYIIVSGDAMAAGGGASGVETRPLGKISVRGRGASLELFEVLVPSYDERSRLKSETRSVFADAVDKYNNARIADALAGFAEISKCNPGDRAAELFVHKCGELLKTGVPEGFDGTEELSE
jgi:class 3 adenylate cyclase/HAMP domain-containing protein